MAGRRACRGSVGEEISPSARRAGERVAPRRRRCSSRAGVTHSRRDSQRPTFHSTRCAMLPFDRWSIRTFVNAFACGTRWCNLHAHVYISSIAQRIASKRRLTFDALHRPRISFLAVISHAVSLYPIAFIWALKVGMIIACRAFSFIRSMPSLDVLAFADHERERNIYIYTYSFIYFIWRYILCTERYRYIYSFAFFNRIIMTFPWFSFCSKWR